MNVRRSSRDRGFAPRADTNCGRIRVDIEGGELGSALDQPPVSLGPSSRYAFEPNAAAASRRETPSVSFTIVPPALQLGEPAFWWPCFEDPGDIAAPIKHVGEHLLVSLGDRHVAATGKRAHVHLAQS